LIKVFKGRNQNRRRKPSDKWRKDYFPSSAFNGGDFLLI
jgi:hypothetical protein